MILPYIINAALVLGACLAFYKVLLRRETFYKVNRYMLLVCLGIAFVLPLFTVPEQFSLRKVSDVGSSKLDVIRPTSNFQPPTSTLRQAQGDKPPTSNLQPPTTPSFESYLTPAVSNSAFDTTVLSWSRFVNWLFGLYWFGVIVFGASFIFQVILLLYRSFRYPVICDGQYRIVEVSGDKAPCSFGNTIFINPSKYDWETYNQILLHEKIHIRQRHTLDILLAELVLIFQWFNPFAWIYRREIESNLEFLTDDQLVQHAAIDKKTYQLSLLKVTAPDSPLSLTNNYNQSILKKRIAMMNTKRSNLHTAWKYFFLLPLLAILACVLNEPKANSQNAAKSESPKDRKTEKNYTENRHNIQSTGYWFAIIKDDEVHIRFSDKELKDEQLDFKHSESFHGTNFKKSELGTLPLGTSGVFFISREAGKMEMTGKFDGNTGMGTYKFVADKSFTAFMSTELKEGLDEEDELAFFFINVKKDYLQMLKKEGFAPIDKDGLIGMSALGVDAAYIKSMRNAFKDVDMENLVAMKAMGIDEKYINEIRSTGIKGMDAEKMISFKAQGIDKEYIAKMKTMKGKDKDLDEDDVEELVSYKAMGIDEAFVNSFKAVGLTDLSHEHLVSFKALGVTPEYIKSWHDAGFKNIDPEEFAGMKSQNVTPEYMKSFKDLGLTIETENLVAFRAMGVTPEYIKSWQNAGFKNIDADEFVGMKSQNVTAEYMKSFADLGYKNIEPENLVAFRALDITPEYIKSFEAMGYKITDLDELPALKSQGVTPEFIRSFEEMGFKNIDIDEIVSAKAMGVTPAYIKEMRGKGFNYNSLEKYIRLKSID
jgi:hypothetical protein